MTDESWVGDAVDVVRKIGLANIPGRYFLFRKMCESTKRTSPSKQEVNITRVQAFLRDFTSYSQYSNLMLLRSGIGITFRNAVKIQVNLISHRKRLLRGL